MEIQHLWYLIERDHLHRVVAAHEYQNLAPDSFTLHQVFENRHDALHELIRLVQTQIEEVSKQIEK
jgi:hypothetical protein